MGNHTSVPRYRGIYWLVVITAVLLNGCAAPPPPKSYHASNYKSDLGKRLDISVNYHLSDDGGVVVVDVSNPRGNSYRYWLVQTNTVDGEYVLRSSRFYSGNKKKHQEVFKIPFPEEGIAQAFFVEVYDANGKLAMKSEPINQQPIKEGKP